MSTIEQKEENRIQAANELFSYVLGSIKPTNITLDFSKFVELQNKLLMAQMQVPDWYRSKSNLFEKLNDERILYCVTKTRDYDEPEIVLICRLLCIMPRHIEKEVCKRLDVYSNCIRRKPAKCSKIFELVYCKK